MYAIFFIYVQCTLSFWVISSNKSKVKLDLQSCEPTPMHVGGGGREGGERGEGGIREGGAGGERGEGG